MALGFRLNGDGTYSVTLSQLDKRLITDLAPQMRELINDRDPIAWRLFPNPYPQHEKAADEYQDMVGDELTSKHIEALETLENSVDKRRVTEEELTQWMHAVNHIRLVIGTRLNVGEESEPDDYAAEDQPLFHTYWYLGAMLEMIVEALAGEDYTSHMSDPDEVE